MEKNFIDEFIPSKDTRAYLHSIHHEFTDLEKATIVANHIMISYEEKVKWLNVFMNKISDDALKDRISKALVQIKKDRKYSRKCNTALGAMHYNESLFDFIFIPHDFRHGDIVRSLYGDWNTTEFCEKVGIILNYSDKDYEFYKKLKGDYSDVQVCVDIKFDGVDYQGEFEHEHINPIYIERMTLNETDERRSYLNYLTNLYSRKKTMMIETDNKPEYTGGSDDLLEQRYLDKYIPVQDDASGIWCVQTGHSFESGDVGYIADVFSGTGLIYHFMYNGKMDHVHGFDGVLTLVRRDALGSYKVNELDSELPNRTNYIVAELNGIEMHIINSHLAQVQNFRYQADWYIAERKRLHNQQWDLLHDALHNIKDENVIFAGDMQESKNSSNLNKLMEDGYIVLGASGTKTVRNNFFTEESCIDHIILSPRARAALGKDPEIIYDNTGVGKYSDHTLLCLCS